MESANGSTQTKALDGGSAPSLVVSKRPVSVAMPTGMEIELDGVRSHLNFAQPMQILDASPVRPETPAATTPGPIDEAFAAPSPLNLVLANSVTSAHLQSSAASGRATPKHGRSRSKTLTKKDLAGYAGDGASSHELPVAVVTESQHQFSLSHWNRPEDYVHNVESDSIRLNGKVEYDMDEEDESWLQLLQKKRERLHLRPISKDVFEFLMDHLEKESFLLTQAGGGYFVDEDAVCSICLDEYSEDGNEILFCDSCNLPVHQDCYGVPYIPDGQWLCRRCFHSPARAVQCTLCTVKGGALKQTTNPAEWAHVLCAYWVPETTFGNDVFLEPINGVENISKDRRRLLCVICKERGGACIQCSKSTCCVAYHATCAQLAGLYMRQSTEAHPESVSYCSEHSPPGHVVRSKKNNHKKKHGVMRLDCNVTQSDQVLSVPVIPKKRVQDLAAHIDIDGKTEFLDQLMSYWALKRQARSGAPLLRRLQGDIKSDAVGVTTNGTQQNNVSSMNSGSDNQFPPTEGQQAQRLRYDLERARLVLELVKRREKAKVQILKLMMSAWKAYVDPLGPSLMTLLDQLSAMDKRDVFARPVSANLFRDNRTIASPMDFGIIRSKITHMQYHCYDEFLKDVNLVFTNAITFFRPESQSSQTATQMQIDSQPLLADAAITINSLPSLEATSANFDPSIFTILGLLGPGDLPAMNSELEGVASTLKRVNDQREQFEHLSPYEILALDHLEPSLLNRFKRKCAPVPKTAKKKLAVALPGSESRPLGRPRAVSLAESAQSPSFESNSPVLNVDITPIHPSRAAAALKAKASSNTLPATPHTAKLAIQPPPLSQQLSLKQSLAVDFQNSPTATATPTTTTTTTAPATPVSGPSRGSIQPQQLSPDIVMEDVVIPARCKVTKVTAGDIVWANCLGRAYIPSEVVVPKKAVLDQMPPPAHILQSRPDSATMPNAVLVCMFDTRRSWSWVSLSQLIRIFDDAELDTQILSDSRKRMKRSIRQAYETAKAAYVARHPGSDLSSF